MKMHLSPLLFSLTVIILSNQRTFAHSATEPVPRPDAGWQNRQKLLNQRATEAGDKAQVIFIGDSITQGWEGDGKDVWAKYYAHRNAVNLGIGGDRTQHVLWRLDNGNLNGLKPKAAVVMIGTNNSNGEDNTPGQIAEGVTAIVKTLRDKLPGTKVLLLAIFPRGENFNNQRGKILQVNQVLHKLADGKNIFWADFGHRFVNSDGTIPHDLMPDYLHLSRKGYEIWAEAIEQRLSQVIGDTRVRGTTAAADVSGDWIWKIRGPNGDDIEAPLILKQEGQIITGRFARDQNRWLTIEDGKLAGNQLSWIVKRDRPNGGTMTYHMTATAEGSRIQGKVTTQVDGNESTQDWSARRK